MKTIGQRIKEKRDELGLTQEELGERLGVSNVAVAHTEADRGNITMNRVRKYAEALNCRVEELTQEYEQKIGKSPIHFINENDPGYELSPTEQILVDRYREIPEEKKEESVGHMLLYSEKIMKGLDS